MKRIVISILAVILLAAAAVTVAAVSSRSAFDHNDVKILTAESLNISTEDRLEMSRDFYIIQARNTKFLACINFIYNDSANVFLFFHTHLDN